MFMCRQMGSPHDRTVMCPYGLLLWCMIVAGLLAPAPVLADTAVTIRSRLSAEDQSYDYFVNLLNLALRKTESSHGPYRIEVVEFKASQGRALKELASIGHAISVAWAGTNNERERMLLPIRIPLTAGLLGYRVPVIRKRDVPKFQEVRTIDALKLFTAIQGTHWPDVSILENAGLKVHTVPHLRQMYPMLKAGRVDYLPRGINEVYSEVEEVNEGRLVVYDKLLIRYHLPVYFFTNKENRALAERIEKGLRKAVDDGSLRRYMRASPVSAPLFPLSQYDDSRILTIENPDLPEDTPLDDTSLWLTLGKGAPRE